MIEFGNWLRHTGSMALHGTWTEMVKELYLHAKGGTQEIEPFHHVMPDNPLRSWISEGWATPCGALPMTVEAEKTIVYKLVAELNDRYDLGLGSEPVVDRLIESSVKKTKF